MSMNSLLEHRIRGFRALQVSKIVYLRQHYHFGPHKIAMYLKRYHDVEVSPSGLWRILKHLDMSRLPASQALPTPRRPVEAFLPAFVDGITRGTGR